MLELLSTIGGVGFLEYKGVNIWFWVVGDGSLEHFLSSFLTYVEDTWYNCYSKEDWNQYDNSTMEHLSNNCCEGGNLRMKNRSKGSYIGMYRFMTIFL